MQRRSFLVLAAAALSTAAAQTPKPEEMYAVVAHYLVPQANMRAYQEILRTDLKKIMQERMNQTPSLIYWAAAAPVYSGVSPEGRMVNLVTVFAGPPPVQTADAYNAAAKKALGISYDEWLKKVNPLRTAAGNELYRGIAMAPGQPEGEYQTVIQYKSAEGKFAANRDLLTNWLQPSMVDSMQRGSGRTGWSAWGLRSPTGENIRYDHVVVHRYKDLAAAVAAGGGMDPVQFQNVHPGKSYTEYIDRVRNDRKIARSQIERIIAEIRRQ
jgi:hypothetical protein